MFTLGSACSGAMVGYTICIGRITGVPVIEEILLIGSTVTGILVASGITIIDLPGVGNVIAAQGVLSAFTVYVPLGRLSQTMVLVLGFTTGLL